MGDAREDEEGVDEDHTIVADLEHVSAHRVLGPTPNERLGDVPSC